MYLDCTDVSRRFDLTKMYHTTYTKYVDSILTNGLGGDVASSHKNFSFSFDKFVCLCGNPDRALSFLERAEEFPDKEAEKSGYTILEVDVSGLYLKDDPNIQDELLDLEEYPEDWCAVYAGVIEPSRITIYEKGDL